MARTDYDSVDAYIAAQPEASRPVLQQVRQAIRAAAPDASEVISYQIPAFRQDKRIVIFFAGWKKHFSVYPAGPDLVEAFRDDLAPYEVNNKGTIRFPLSAPPPLDLIKRIVSYRLAALAAGEET